MVEAQATARGIRTSAQKAGLVCELIRGKNVNQALATLQFTRKTIARELAKVLRSAVANAAAEGRLRRRHRSALCVGVLRQPGPVDEARASGPDGPRLRVVKRTAHLTVQVAERPLKIEAVGDAKAATRRAKPSAGAERRARGEESRRNGVAKD